MKIIKLNKTDYWNMEALLKRAGLIDESGTRASPDRLLVNEATYKKIQQVLTKEQKKAYPYLSKSKIKYAVAAYLLNLGPNVIKNQNGGANLKKGYAIVV